MVEQGIEQRPTNVVLRRVTAIVLTGLVVVAVSTVFVARRNPWHYVHLMPFGRTPVVATVVLAVPVLLGVAAWLVLRPALARAVAVVATVLALVMDLTCFQFSTAASLFGFESDGDTQVVAVSPKGSFEVVGSAAPAGDRCSHAA
jgi:glucose dehydrogenase